ncbi:MAG: CHAT domain-containing protein [Myxococcota bacterium]
MSGRALLLLACLAGACASERPGPDPNPAPPRKHLGVLRAERIAHSPQDELLPSISADGRYLAYVSSESGNLEISVRDLLLGVSQPITDSAADDSDPAIAPSGKELVFMSRRFDAKGDLLKVGLLGGTPERLTDDATADRQPIYAPDGKRLFYTASAPIGLEYIATYDLGSRQSRRLSPTPGFDPAPTPDGKYLVYTAPAGIGGAQAPHLVLLRLSDTATRAVTEGATPAGFARVRLDPAGHTELAFVRFADDDNEDGRVDGNDQASLWALRLDPEALFLGHRGAVSEPWPLTTGADDELFVEPHGAYLYFTSSAGDDQNIVRLPREGAFPDWSEAGPYLHLAAELLDRRERWFALRAAVARAPHGDRLRAQALLEIAELQRDSGHPILFRQSLSELAQETEGAAKQGPIDEIRGLSTVDRIAFDRAEALGAAATPVERERALRLAQRRLRDLEGEYGWSERVRARVALELVELDIARGKRLESAEALDRLAQAEEKVPEVAARALLRRTELLDVGFDPAALGEAYAEVARRFPTERAIVRQASAKAVAGVLRAVGDPEGAVAIEALRQLIGRTPAMPIRFAARERLIDLLASSDHPRLAEVEAHTLSEEALQAGDRLLAARSLGRAAELEEAHQRWEEAFVSLRRLKAEHSDVGAEIDRAEAALTRVAMANAGQAKASGNLAQARDLYLEVLANDPTVISAYRSYFALASATGTLDVAVSAAADKVKAEPKSAIPRYAHALGLTYQNPPDLLGAQKEIDAALSLNPELASGYLLRGWIQEMLESKDRSGYLEQAIESYTRAYRIAKDALDRQLEIDALLNLGNAKWRLGDQTNDTTNLELAAKDWVEFLSLGGNVEAPLGRLVFWERLGRAAAWAQDYALSTMASREAQRLALELDRKERLEQIYGNLALAYSAAGETAYADQAFSDLTASLSPKTKTARVAIAKRNSAYGKLARRARTGEGDIGGALADLEDSRRLLGDADLGSLIPSGMMVLISMTVPDGSRAPLGFTELVERDLNLSLAASVHRQRGEAARAEEIDGLRQALLTQIRGDHTPVTLNILRESLGLKVAAAKRTCRARDLEGCKRALEASLEEIDRSADDKAWAKDLDNLLVDRGRVVAIVAEEEALWRGAGRSLGLKVDLLARLDRERAALGGIGGGDGLLATLTSSVAVLEASETAQEALGTLARLEHARGLLLAAPMLSARPKAQLPAILEELDRGVEQLGAARAAFARAAALGDRAPTPSLGRVAIAARHALELLDAAAPVKSGTTAASLPASAWPGASRTSLDRALFTALSKGKDGAAEIESRMRGTLPALLGADDPLIARWFAQTASAAVAAHDAERALEIADRALLFEVAARGLNAVFDARSSEDATVVRAIQPALARLRLAEASLSPEPGEGAAGAKRRLAEAEQRLTEARRALAEATDAALGKRGRALASTGLAARLFGESAGAAQIQGSLAEDQALVVPLELVDRSLWIVVRGSTSTIAMIPSPIAFAELRRALASPHDPTAAPADRARMVEAVRGTLSPALEGVSVLALADAKLPLPAAVIFPGLAVSHLSAPSGLVAAVDRAPLGASGIVEIYGASGQKRLPDSVGLDRATTLALAARDLDHLPLGARALLSHASAVVVIRAPAALNAAAPEAARLWLGAGDPAQVPAPDRYRDEVLLGDLPLSAGAWILTDVDAAAQRGLDLGLSYRSAAPLVLIPHQAEPAGTEALVSALVKDAPELGVAAATARALEALLPKYPGLGEVLVLGGPGVAKAKEADLAKARIGPLKQQLRLLAQQGRWADVSDKVQEILRLQTAADDKSEQAGLYALANIALGRFGRWREAADLGQEAYRAATKPDAKATARQNLLKALGMVKDWDGARAVIDPVIRELTEKRDPVGLAVAYRQLAELEKARPDLRAASGAYAHAEEAYEAQHACAKAETAQEAAETLRTHARLYLERMSDPAAAKPLLERARACGEDPVRNAGLLCDLAEVERKRGLFEAAGRYAEEAKKLAIAQKRSEIQLRAEIEAANIAWYRGDVAIGRSRCQSARALAETRLAEVRQNKLQNPRAQIRDLIFATSACGLLEMSAGESDAAERTLQKAVRLAISIASDPDVAAQYNNLGRVYLESGRTDDAIDSFRRAQRLDEKTQDEFGVAYDLRNLGTALMVRERYEEAEKALKRALELSEKSQDDNNKMRTLFALGELYRRQDRRPQALQAYQSAGPLALRQENLELAWQIERSAALLEGSETGLLRAADLVRRLSGHSTPSQLSPERYAPFDDLVLLYLSRRRPEQAFAAAEAARALGSTERLDDRRLTRWPSLDPPRQARTATAAARSVTALFERAPGVARRFRQASAAALAPRIPSDALVLDYHPTAAGLVIFGLDGSGLRTASVAISAEALGAKLGALDLALRNQGATEAPLATISAVLLDPIRPWILGKKRLVTVLGAGLGRVPFMALPLEPGVLVVDRYLSFGALDVSAAVEALERPPSLGSAKLKLVGPDRLLGRAPLSFVGRELEAITESLPRAEVLLHDRATKAAVIGGIAASDRALHFAGHAEPHPSDPLSGDLLLADGALSLSELLNAEIRAKLVVLSACASLPEPPREDAARALRSSLSLSDGLLLGGAEAVVASTLPIDDVASALMMKRFYRALAALPVAEALRQAALDVRARAPHPAWWASFSLVVGGDATAP